MGPIPVSLRVGPVQRTRMPSKTVLRYVPMTQFPILPQLEPAEAGHQHSESDVNCTEPACAEEVEDHRGRDEPCAASEHRVFFPTPQVDKLAGGNPENCQRSETRLSMVRNQVRILMRSMSWAPFRPLPKSAWTISARNSGSTLIALNAHSQSGMDSAKLRFPRLIATIRAGWRKLGRGRR